jgi:hypothetical protein
VKALAAAAVVVLSPNPAHFGDLVTAKVSGAKAPSFVPLSVREHHGGTYVLQCLDPVCVPGPGARTVKIGDARLVILPRATTDQVARPLRSFRRQTEIPAPSYFIRPGLLRVLLFAAAGLLTVLAVLLAAPVVRRLIPEPRDERTPLQRALDLVRASLRRDGEERRRALDVLGRTLENDPRARAAFDLAWSAPEPEPDRVRAFVDEVEART